MKTVEQVLNSKGNTILTIGPDDSVFDAIKLMSEKAVGALPVLENEKLVGIITERDYARKVILKGKMSQQTPVREIMTPSVLCAQPEQTIEECMVLMTDKRIRHLPVVDGGQLVGIISIGDLVKAVIAEQKFIIKQLEHYISGAPM
jgi:CBS domain-containing protein